MLANKKEQGFIIRKSRNISRGDRNQERRHMSQTEFYRSAPDSSPLGRTPGQILHLKLKENIGFIRSSQTNWFNQKEDSNPE